MVSVYAEKKQEVAASDKKEKRGLLDLGYGGHGYGLDGHAALELSAGHDFGGHGLELVSGHGFGGHGLELAGGHGIGASFGSGLDHGHLKQITIHKEVKYINLHICILCTFF